MGQDTCSIKACERPIAYRELKLCKACYMLIWTRMRGDKAEREAWVRLAEMNISRARLMQKLKVQMQPRATLTKVS